ncbi:MAG: cation transporter [Sulfolobales archaeon]|nr:cation transporter [Sulfolobales archaeon]MDW7969274.1 cation transporter [Sulfolobales archaeon]
MSAERIAASLIVLSIVGGLLKIYGSFVGGSKSIFVDALTSAANTLAIVLILRFFKVGAVPPDRDHPYGHYRLALGGSISMLMLYSFVAGIVILDLINSFNKPYTVNYESPLYAAVALIPYGIAIYVGRKGNSILSGYAGFTAVELIESLISITSSIGGIAVSYLVDYAGATILTAYLLRELTISIRDVVNLVSDIAPDDVVEKVFNDVTSHGLEVGRVRVRKVLENVYQGDVVVKLPPNTSVEDSHKVADIIEKELKSRGIDILVHVEPNSKDAVNPKER